MQGRHRGAWRRTLAAAMLALSLIPLSAHTAGAATVKPSLRTISVPNFRIGSVGQGWLTSKRVVVSLHAGPWVVGVEVRPTHQGTFKVAIKRVDLCGGVWFQAKDTAGHTKIARGPALACASASHPPKPTMTVIGGTQVSTTTYQVIGNSPKTVKMQVGDKLYLWEPGSTVPSYTPNVDVSYLALIQQGKTPPRMCPAVNCGEGFEWTWVAIRTGETILDLSPWCRQVTPPCMAPDLGIRILIQP